MIKMNEIIDELNKNNIIYLKIDDELFIFIDDDEKFELFELIDPIIQQIKKHDENIENKIYVLKE